jgi:YcaO-like protein with predicted kinase domain
MLPDVIADLTVPFRWAPQIGGAPLLSTGLGLREVDPHQTIKKIRPAFRTLDIDYVQIDENEHMGVSVYWCLLRHRLLAGEAQRYWNFGGKGYSPACAELSMMVESLERVICSRLYHPELIIAPFDKVREVVLEGALLGGLRVEDNSPQEWGWVSNLRTGEPKLVHASFLLAPYRPVYGKSLCESDYNGIAGGNSIDEAILHGICELIERDVLVRVSRHRPQLQRIELSTVQDQNCQRVIKNFERRGTELVVFNLTTTASVHTFGSMVFDDGFVRPISPLVCGTHPLPSIALARSLAELCQVRANTIFVEECAPRPVTRAESRQIAEQFLSSFRTKAPSIPFPNEAAFTPRPLQELVWTIIGDLSNSKIEVYCALMGNVPEALYVVRIIAVGLQPLTSTVQLIGDNSVELFSPREIPALSICPTFIYHDNSS